MSLIYKQESYNIIGACFEVYNELGSGYDEPIYHEALELELTDRNIPYVSEPQLKIRYKEHILKKYFKPDMIAYQKIIIELKAVKELTEAHRSQVHKYLKTTGYELALLVNFCNPGKLEYERIVKTNQPPKEPPPRLQG